MIQSNNGDLDTWIFSYVVNDKGHLSGEMRIRNPIDPGFYYSMPIEEALCLRVTPTGFIRNRPVQFEFDDIRPPDWSIPRVGASNGGGVNFYSRV